jgi:hypothetical protein
MKRWITPVGLLSQVELQTSVSERTIRVCLDGQNGFITLTMEEAEEVRNDLGEALEYLREETEKYKERKQSIAGVTAEIPESSPQPIGGVCCDPGNENRPRDGCDCDCCEELRYVRLRPEMPTLP